MSLAGPSRVTQSPSRASTPAGRDGLAPADLPGLERRELDARERERARGRAGRRGAAASRSAGVRASKRSSGTASDDREVADAGAAQRLQVGAAAELLAELARDRADVGPRGARDRERRARRPRAVPKSSSRDADLLGHRRHALALARHLVELAPADLLGGVRRRRLEELAAEGRGGASTASRGHAARRRGRRRPSRPRGRRSSWPGRGGSCPRRTCPSA